jgi:hypothetical protein
MLKYLLLVFVVIVLGCGNSNSEDDFDCRSCWGVGDIIGCKLAVKNSGCIILPDLGECQKYKISPQSVTSTNDKWKNGLCRISINPQGVCIQGVIDKVNKEANTNAAKFAQSITEGAAKGVTEALIAAVVA